MEADHYVIVNSAGSRLSSFYPNTCTQQLFFRRRDWYIFSTSKEAKGMISHIKEYGIGKALFVQGVTINT